MPTYANVTATLALFIALGGTATAAVTLERDSVTSREIASNAVRSAEIAKDAVRSPEIRADAVRSSEIQDDTIRLEDIADGARQALEGERGPAGPQGPAGPEGPSGTSEANFTQDDEATVPRCPQLDLAECPNLHSVLLSSGSWVVQAKLTALGALGGGNRCGLVTGDTTTVDLAAPLQAEISNNLARFSLAAVITLDEPARVALRCAEFGPLELTVFNLDLIAISVDKVVSS
jgi:hypothetical protein